jgi:hypothetical protein
MLTYKYPTDLPAELPPTSAAWRQFARFVVVFTLVVITAAPAFAQPEPLPMQRSDRVVPAPLLSNQELILSLCVLVFGTFVVFIEYRLLSRTKSRADEVLRTLTVTLIVVVSLALVSSGYGKDQITPVLGLFGTILGYLLGANASSQGAASSKRGEEEP